MRPIVIPGIIPLLPIRQGEDKIVIHTIANDNFGVNFINPKDFRMDKFVYIIDDDPVYLKFMKEHFKQLGGFQTEIFLNGDEGIKRIEQQSPYLVILDNHLEEPNKSGIFYLKIISKIRPRIPVIYITADTDPELKKTITKVGVKSYILKDSAFLVYLRTALDDIANPPKKSLLKKIFG